MYEVICDELVDANVASTTLPYFTDPEGNVVDKADCYGHVQTIKITKPDWILMADESGFLISQKNDGHVGGQRWFRKQWHVQQITNLLCSPSPQRWVKQFVVW